VGGPTTPIWVVPWSLDENTNNSDVQGTNVKEGGIIEIIHEQPWTRHIYYTRHFSRFYFLQLSKCSCASMVTTANCFLLMTNTCHLTLSRPSRTEAEALFIRAWYGTKPWEAKCFSVYQVRHRIEHWGNMSRGLNGVSSSYSLPSFYALFAKSWQNTRFADYNYLSRPKLFDGPCDIGSKIRIEYFFIASNTLWAKQPRNQGSISNRNKKFIPLPQCTDSFWGPFDLICRVPGSLNQRVNRPGHETDYWPLSSAEIKNACSYTSTLPAVFTV
jgi:hypothetical protein